ncbi:MAG: outer-membrane lipoprotein carrier protein LolA [Spirochaetia bacterium]|nr:outer-membrane lipoprotein carrier protein LolA [Spirochaetota bacterium]MCX8097206.1 outer-membrane lipoprotein carrier protein LolA [Spirochaetota bacterium]MDW8111960.1 outer-membrane lipoprotein carrier protein LolA [Spirochaetia bacterium]
MIRFLIIVLTLFISNVVFPSITADVAIRELKNAYNSIKTFTGSITIKIGNKTYTGTIKYKMPNKLKINFYQPSQIDLISDGNSMWIFIKGNNTVIKQPLLPKRGDRVIYVSEIINPYDKYNSEYIITMDKYDDKTFSFNLKPKPDVFTTFSSAKLVSSRRGLVLSISGTTVTREQLSISVSYSSVNIEIDDREFFFSPPADAQVLTDIFQ